MTNARFTKVSLLPLGAAFVLLCSVGFAAAQGTPPQQQAWAPDAQRLCGEFIPDIPKIQACVSLKRAQLSAACRATIVGPSPGHSRRHHR